MRNIIITTLVILLGMQTPLSASAAVSTKAPATMEEIHTGADLANLFEQSEKALAFVTTATGKSGEEVIALANAMTPEDVEEFKDSAAQEQEVAIFGLAIGLGLTVAYLAVIVAFISWVL